MNQFQCVVARKSASESQHCLVSRATAVPALHVVCTVYVGGEPRGKFRARRLI